MQLSALLLALAACGSASAASIRSNDDICYKVCPQGQFCARGTTTCRPPAGAECFDVLKATWVPQCGPGFACQNGKCDVAPSGQPVTEAPATEAPEDAEDPETEAPAEAPEDSEAETEAPETEAPVPEAPEDAEPETNDDNDSAENNEGEEGDDESNDAEGTSEPVKEEPENADAANGAVCYKLCPEGQYCARGSSTCRAPKVDSTECFNMATAMWVAQCDKDYTCSNGKCVLA